MAQISTADFKNGIALSLDDGLFTLVEFQHVKPGKGGAFVRTKLKNVRNGAVLERTFRSGERMEKANIDQREMPLLYKDGEHYVFMDNRTYDQTEVPEASVGAMVDYLVPGMNPVVRFCEGEIVGVDLPASVDLEVTETEPGVQGDRVSGATKPATLETGKVVRVPLFVNPGDRIIVDTRTGAYINRA
jgi:elongation factor P